MYLNTTILSFYRPFFPNELHDNQKMVETGAKVELQEKLQKGFKNLKDRFLSSNQDVLDYGTSQISQRMLNNIVTSEKVPVDAKRLQLRQLTSHIFKETALNEVQASVWALLVDRMAWDDSNFSLWFKLLASALYSKEFLGEPVEYLISKYTEKDEKFANNYQLWRNCIQKIVLTVREINQKFNEINIGKIVKMNYNFYVDEIIFTYQPYKKYLKSKKVEVDDDSDLDFFAEIEPVPTKRKRRSKICKMDEVCVKKLAGLLNLDI